MAHKMVTSDRLHTLFLICLGVLLICIMLLCMLEAVTAEKRIKIVDCYDNKNNKIIGARCKEVTNLGVVSESLEHSSFVKAFTSVVKST